MAGRAYPNFRVLIESSTLEKDLILHLRDVRIRVIPAGPKRRQNDTCIQLRGFVRATGALETRANLALSSTGQEIGLATVRLETRPAEPEDKCRLWHVRRGGRSPSKVTARTIERLLGFGARKEEDGEAQGE